MAAPSPEARAWITGAAGGIGQAITRRLAARGYWPVMFDRDENGLRALQAELGGDVVPCDLADSAALIDQCDAILQPGTPEVLVNNAAIAMTPARIEDVELDTWQRTIATNLTAPFVITRSVLPAMRQRRFGRIVSVASSSAIRVSPQQSAYVSSKAALIALTKSVALEYGRDGITANIVCPGVTVTPMTTAVFGDEDAVRAASVTGPLANPMGAPIEPDDIARVVEFLVSDGAARVTGQTVHCNAGSFMP